MSIACEQRIKHFNRPAGRAAGTHLRWDTKHIGETWEATDPRDDSECVLTITKDGTEHSGYFMEPTKGPRPRLFVSYTDARAAKRRMDA